MAFQSRHDTVISTPSTFRGPLISFRRAEKQSRRNRAQNWMLRHYRRHVDTTIWQTHFIRPVNCPYKTADRGAKTNFIQTSVLELPVSATDTPQSLKLIGIRWSLQLVKLLAVTAWQQQPIAARFVWVAAPFS